MAFISSGYDPAKPMEGRISDIGPRPYDSFFPEVIAKNFGKWLYHEILEPGVLMHVAESGDKVYTVRCGGARTITTVHIREICEIADKYCGGCVRFTTRNNVEFMVTDEETLAALKADLASLPQPEPEQAPILHQVLNQGYSGAPIIVRRNLDLPPLDPLDRDPHHHAQHWHAMGFNAEEISRITGVPAGDVLRALKDRDLGPYATKQLISKGKIFESCLVD